jgi:sugar phosphate isomerase/epimerase
MKRRTFLKLGAMAGSAATLAPMNSFSALGNLNAPVFKISLAEWSLHRALQSGKIKNIDFPHIAKKDYQIDCVEFVDQFFADKSKDKQYLNDLKDRAYSEGVRCGLLMVDTNGPLGAADESTRKAAVEKTLAWIDAAKLLGCATVRVNAYGDGSPEDWRARVAESCAGLADHAAQLKLNLAIENHGGLSSDPVWLASLIKMVNKPNFGTLPDFGNFPEGVDRYLAIEAMLPFAKAVSAKATKFAPGEILDTNFYRMMRLVRDSGYNGYVGIETAPPDEQDEAEAIRTTRDILLSVREEQERCKSIFNGKDLTGWTMIEGGEWTVENGVLIGKNGVNWSTDPEKTGSWLSSKKQYRNFRLELQFMINEKGNSGIFLRSSHEKNPAFTGYEVQIYDAPGSEPSVHGPGSLYDLVAPEKNTLRKAGEWNTLTIEAMGSKIRIEMNGEKILETEQNRSMRGYIGLQNHDDKSEVRLKNIRIDERPALYY